MLEGVTISESKAQKDEYILEGSDVQNVSQSGLCGHQSLFSHRLTSFKLHRFKASVVCGTRISVNSWMVSTYRRRARWYKNERSLYPLISLPFPYIDPKIIACPLLAPHLLCFSHTYLWAIHAMSEYALFPRCDFVIDK